MKNKLLLIVVVVLTVVLVLDNKRELSKKIINNKNKTIEVKNKETGIVKKQDLEDYVVGVVAAEMPATFLDEALKAQAIASRTYAYYKMKNSNGDYDILADVSDQAYIDQDQMREKWKNNYEQYYNKIKKAVQATSGKIMTYNDEVIESFYFAMSNGYTENVENVFGESLPYLKSVESKWDNPSLNKYELTTTMTKANFCNKLGIECDSINIQNQEYDDTGRTEKITINEKKFKGTEFRKLLDLRSTDFKIEVNGNDINIITKGYGHGVGMSQYGANGMAKEGYNYSEILRYYYKDIEIKKI